MAAKSNWVPSKPGALSAGTTLTTTAPATTTPAVQAYDWSNVPEGDRDAVKRSASIIVRATAAAGESLLSIGEELTYIKLHAPDGEFLNICADVLDIPARTAQHLMNVWRVWQDRRADFSLFGDKTKVFELSGPTVKDETRQAAVDAEKQARSNGHSLSRSELRVIIAAGKQENNAASGHSEAATTFTSDTGTVGLDTSLSTFVPAKTPSEMTIDSTATVVDTDTIRTEAPEDLPTRNSIAQLYAAIEAIKYLETKSGRQWPIARSHIEGIIRTFEKE